MIVKHNTSRYLIIGMQKSAEYKKIEGKKIYVRTTFIDRGGAINRLTNDNVPKTYINKPEIGIEKKTYIEAIY